ncbi:Rne/Rng family ribonuclease, partial [Georgenia sp. Marseille-Q6866]
MRPPSPQPRPRATPPRPPTRRRPPTPPRPPRRPARRVAPRPRPPRRRRRPPRPPRRPQRRTPPTPLPRSPPAAVAAARAPPPGHPPSPPPPTPVPPPRPRAAPVPRFVRPATRMPPSSPSRRRRSPLPTRPPSRPRPHGRARAARPVTPRRSSTSSPPSAPPSRQPPTSTRTRPRRRRRTSACPRRPCSSRRRTPAAPAAAPAPRAAPAPPHGRHRGARRPRGARSHGRGARRRGRPAPADEPAEATDETRTDTDSTDAEAGNGEGGGARRRRRRGGRGRRNRGGNGRDESTDESEDSDSTDDTEDEAAEAADGPDTDTHASDAQDDSDDADDSDDQGDSDDDGEGASRRRRRRRRSRGDDGSATSREGRAARDEITALKGSTRLEAKRQRRRDGRDAGRRRTTITEAEFLARREAVDRDMVVRERDGRTQIAVLEDGVLVEHYVAQQTQTSMVGNVYLGRVQNVLPSMEAAFVDLGKGRNAVLYAGEVNWDAMGKEGQPRRIEAALSSGDPVLVQVTKDPIGHKGARLTSQVTLAGRYLVLVPSGAMTGISRKLPENERARLKKLLKQIVPEGAGVIVRTAAEGASEEQLRADVERLTAQWAEIEAAAASTKSAPVLLKGEPELAVRVVRDVFNEDFRSLTVSGDGAWDTISTYVRQLSPDLADRMHHWTDQRDVFAEHRIDEQLAKGMDRKVYLPSGGSLVIDRTEAMTVVDVNTGKFTGSGGTLEETVTKNNLEAAEEIVRQLRLRDIGGIIVIDFIDMVLESNRDLVMRRLVECLGRDRTRHQVAEVTSLGLVQMTRKRVGQGLVEAFSEPCEHCGGRGFIVHDHPVEKGSGSAAEGEGGNRRRKQRGAAPTGGRPAEVAVPAAAPAPVSDDPEAVAAREAVKATLATIAAAAAQAHAEDEDGTSADAAPDAAPAQQKAPAQEKAPAQQKAPRRERAAEPSTVSLPAARASEPAPDASRSAEEVRASLEALAAALPAGREDAAPALEKDGAVQEAAPAEPTTGSAPADAPAKAPRARGGRRRTTAPTTAPAPAQDAAPAKDAAPTQDA